MTADNINAAYNEIAKVIYDALSPLGFQINWPGRKTVKPSGSPWFDVSISHDKGQQLTLSNGEGQVLWERSGRVIVSINSPTGKGMIDAYGYAQTLLDQLDGKKTLSGVWFKDTIFKEQKSDGDVVRVNVFSNFTYEELK